MKKFLVLFVCLLLAGCGIREKINADDDSIDENVPQVEEVKERKDIEDFKEEYESLNETSVELTVDVNAKVEYLTEDETIDFINNGTGILYLGFPTCPWCRNILPILLKLSIDNNEVVHYLNPNNASDRAYEEIKGMLIDYLEIDPKTGEKVLYVPDVYFIEDGVIKGHHMGSVDSQINPYEPLDAKQKEEVYNIYKNLLDKIGG